VISLGSAKTTLCKVCNFVTASLAITLRLALNRISHRQGWDAPAIRRFGRAHD